MMIDLVCKSIPAEPPQQLSQVLFLFHSEETQFKSQPHTPKQRVKKYVKIFNKKGGYDGKGDNLLGKSLKGNK